MTVTSTDNKVVYAGDGGTTAFNFSFKVDSDGDLHVILTDSTGTETTRTISTDYAVARNSDQDASPGGTVTMVTAPASGETLTIIRELALTQQTDLSPFSALPAETLEDIADRLTMLAQQINERIGRGLTLPVSETAIGDLPTLDARKGKALAFNASTGDPEALAFASIAPSLDTVLNALANGDFLQYDSAGGTWVNLTPAAVRTAIGAPSTTEAVMIAGGQKFAAGFDWDTYAITYASAVTLDPQNGPTQHVTLTGDITLTLPTTNDYSMFLEIIQDGTGSRAVTWSGADDVNGSVGTAASSRTEVHIKNTNGWVTINARDVTP